VEGVVTVGALEIVAVGLGQAGGNFAAELARRGYRAMAFNTAATDLSTLSSSGLSLPDELRVYIGLDGHDGTGSDVNYARQCIAQNAAQIRERIAQHAAGADIVLITCGLGGGTGSAAAELVHVLEELSLPLMILATLPSSHESGLAKVNAVRAVNELVKEHLLGWIFVDNNRLAGSHGNVSLDRYYTEINRVVVDPLDALNHLNTREGVTPIRSLDGEDLRTLLLSHGLLNFGAKELTEVGTESVIEAVREAVQFSAIMPQGFAMDSLSSLGLVLEVPEAILAQTPFAQFERLSEQLKDKTGGAAVHLGLYRSGNADKATIRLVCASQQLPEGVREMVASARREGSQLRDKLQQTLTGLDLGDIAEYEFLRTGPGAVRQPRSTDPAATPGTPPRRPLRPSTTPQPEPSASAASTGVAPDPASASPSPDASAPPPSSTSTAGDAQPEQRSAAEADANVAPDSEAASPGAASSTPAATSASGASRQNSALAHLATYDQLIREYQAAQTDSARLIVRERLENDRKSENSQVRYYVVRAMAKLGASLFSDALQAAMSDEDASVRAIATKALK
jgi:cell division protein FtsZ